MLILDVQKVLHLYKEEEKKKPKIQGDYLITEKLDGWYAYLDHFTSTGWGEVTSRQDRVIPSMLHARDNFIALYPRPQINFRVIFEITIPGLDFHTANGILNRSIGDCQAIDSIINVHDIVFYDNLKLINLERWNMLQSLPLGGQDKIVKVPLLGISDKKEVWMHYANQVWEKGGEGIVLKEANGVYHSGKRNSSLMKVKLEEETTLRCIDYFYTIGEKGNSNLNATMVGEDGVKVVVRIGKHSDIARIKEDSSYILSQLCKIVYMCKLSGGQLREARFVSVL
jgi:hypothetical protein